MIQITQDITLDVWRKTIFDAIIAKQYDVNSRFLRVTVKQNGETYTVPAKASVSINCQRPDGQSNSYAGTANEDGTATVPIPAWALQLDGQVECDITVADDVSVLKTLKFTIEVQEAVADDTEISEDEYTLWQEILMNAREAEESAEKAATAATTAQQSAESAVNKVTTLETNITAAEEARVTAEQQRVKAEQSRATAENERVSAEQERVTAETARANAEQQRANAETERASAESSRSTAESGRDTDEEGRVWAENARVAAEQQRATDYAALQEELGDSIENINNAAQSAEIVQEIAAQMQLALYYDEEGYVCADEVTVDNTTNNNN